MCSEPLQLCLELMKIKVKNLVAVEKNNINT